MQRSSYIVQRPRKRHQLLRPKETGQWHSVLTQSRHWVVTQSIASNLSLMSCVPQCVPPRVPLGQGRFAGRWHAYSGLIKDWPLECQRWPRVAPEWHGLSSLHPDMHLSPSSPVRLIKRNLVVSDESGHLGRRPLKAIIFAKGLFAQFLQLLATYSLSLRAYHHPWFAGIMLQST